MASTSSAYREWASVHTPGRWVACLWTRETAGSQPHHQLIVPDGCVDLIWRAEGGGPELVGPDQGPRIARSDGGEAIAAVRLRPGAAGLLLGSVPTPEVLDRQLPLADLSRRLDAWARRLTDRPPPPNAAAAAHLLDRHLPELLAAYTPDPAVERAIAALVCTPPPSLSALADELGLSERQLRRRLTTAVGYGPTALRGILRFQRALALGRGAGLPLADLALRTGYADQAHLTREFHRLAGTTPARLLPSRPAGSAVRSA